MVGVAALWCGCLSDFESGGLSFVTNLSRPGAPWTGGPVLLAFDIDVRVNDYRVCWSNCPAPEWPGVLLRGNSVSLSGRSAEGFRLEAQRPGITEVTVGMNGLLGGFGVAVAPAASLSLSDPLVGAKHFFEQSALSDAGVREPVEVGDELVIHDGARALLDLVALDDAGVRMGVSPGQVIATGPDAVLRDGLVSLGSAPGTVMVQLPDGGLPRSYTVRPGQVAEISALTLEAVIPGTFEQYTVLKATALRADGGAYLSPPLVWSIDPRFEVIDYSQHPLEFPRRSDVGLVNRTCTDAGTGSITVNVNGLTASTEVPCLFVPQEEEPPAPVPPTPRQGCSTAPVSLGLVALAAWLRRRSCRGS